MKKNEKKVPFFANFLEKQVKPEEVVGGDKGKDKTTTLRDDLVTLKYPSDGDEPTWEPEVMGW